MQNIVGQKIVSMLSADGTLEVRLDALRLPAPEADQIIVEVEAAPINPSDLGVLFGAADLNGARYLPGRIVARMAEDVTGMMSARHGAALPAGNECSGVVVAAGDDASAQALLGKRVACRSGSAFATHTITAAHMAMELPSPITAEQGASSFVNPLTALGFLETMRRDGFSGIVHAAAASNLGQMLVKLCAADGVPLVNIVRSAEQVALLKGLGASHALDSTREDFKERLAEAIADTGAMLGFDPIRGGAMGGQILQAMERGAKLAQANAGFALYGSNTSKKLYVYAILDFSPMVLNLDIDFRWQIQGWLLPYFHETVGPQVAAQHRKRVLAELTTTFASQYAARIGLEEMLSRDAVIRYAARKTGEKFLLTP